MQDRLAPDRPRDIERDARVHNDRQVEPVSFLPTVLTIALVIGLVVAFIAMLTPSTPTNVQRTEAPVTTTQPTTAPK